MFEGWGERIKYARRTAKYEQKELARLVGKSLGTISRWEREANRPSPMEWPELAKVLGTSLEWLRDGKEPSTGSGSTPNPRTIIAMATRSGKTASLQRIFDATTGSGSLSTGSLPVLREFAEENCTSQEETVHWSWVIRAYDEVMAYVEMGQEMGGDPSELLGKLPRATMTVYHFLVEHEGRTPTLREINALLRDL